MRLLVTGGGGQVGAALAARGGVSGLEVAAPARAALDIRDHAALGRALDTARPQAVINAAAYTAVDRAESERDRAFAINAEAPGLLARLCAARGVPLVQLSTDYVFDGTKAGPYGEDDAPAPLNVYGASKLAGERAVAASGARHVVLRTSWVFAAGGSNFVRTMLRLGREREEIAVVGDQVGCPTAADDVARAALAAASALVGGHAPPPLLHWCGADPLSWFDFAARIFMAAEAQGCRRPHLRRIATAEYPTAARRPPNSVLDCSRAERALGLVRRGLDDALAETVPALLALDQPR